MSEQKWKPGDVAMWRFGSADPQRALRVPSCPNEAHASRDHWHLASGGWTSDDSSHHLNPLVAIGLGSDVLPHAAGRTEGQLLVSMLRETAENFFTPDAAELASRIADEIEAQIEPPAPPKPDEPLGLGAVVEDADGGKWMRTLEEPAFQPWAPVGQISVDRCLCAYGDFKAVRVLSEGVTP